jgi:hypothetical protein
MLQRKLRLYLNNSNVGIMMIGIHYSAWIQAIEYIQESDEILDNYLSYSADWDYSIHALKSLCSGLLDFSRSIV